MTKSTSSLPSPGSAVLRVLVEYSHGAACAERIRQVVQLDLSPPVSGGLTEVRIETQTEPSPSKRQPTLEPDAGVEARN